MAKICYWDLETSGLHSSNDFIISCSIGYEEEGEYKNDFYMLDPVSNNEKELLVKIYNRLRDFEYHVSYNGETFDLPFLFHRLHHNGLDVSRVYKYWKRDKFFNNSQHVIFPDLNQFDFFELIPSLFNNIDFKSLKLNEVAKTLIGENKIDLGYKLPIELFSSGDFKTLEEYNNMDVELLYKLDKKLKITDIALELMKYTNSKSHQVVNRSKLWNNYFETKMGLKGGQHNTMPNIIKNNGGWNKNPISGYFNNNEQRIFSIDFKSLYPSIMVEFKDQKGFNKQFGFMIQNMMNERFKAKLNGEVSRQYAIKTQINSGYGVLSYLYSSYFNPLMAAYITLVGRLLTRLAHKYAEECNMEVLMTSTDSLYIKTPLGISISNWLDKVHLEIDYFVQYLKERDIFSELHNETNFFNLNQWETDLIDDYKFDKDTKKVHETIIRFEFENEIKSIVLTNRIKNYAYKTIHNDYKFIGSIFNKSNQANIVNEITKSFLKDLLDDKLDTTKPFKINKYINDKIENCNSIVDLSIPFKIGVKNYSKVLREGKNSYTAHAVKNSIDFLDKDLEKGQKAYILQFKNNKFEIPDHRLNDLWLAFTLEDLEKNTYNIKQNNLKLDNIIRLSKNNLNKIIEELNIFNIQTTLNDYLTF